MARFYGVIGYGVDAEVEPGLYKKHIIEKTVSGDLMRNHMRVENGDRINDNITISNEITFIADPYARDHFLDALYIKFITPSLGGVWEVSSADVELPRLRMTLGGLYNGEQA